MLKRELEFDSQGSPIGDAEATRIRVSLGKPTLSQSGRKPARRDIPEVENAGSACFNHA